jgi:hypothetical protein
MFSRSHLATSHLEDARQLRVSGRSYRQIRRELDLSPAQLGAIRRALKREKAATTRLRAKLPAATDRDFPVGQSILPLGLRKILMTAGYQTLGDLADRVSDPAQPGLETLAGIGPHRAILVRRLLDQYDLLPATDDLRAAVEQVFPDFSDSHAGEAPSKPRATSTARTR